MFNSEKDSSTHVIETIALNNIMNIDHTYIDQDGTVASNTLSLSCKLEVKTPINIDEYFHSQMQNIKDYIVLLMNKRNIGYNHKLWFIDGFSGGEEPVYDDNDGVTIKTESTFLSVPKSSVCNLVGNDYFKAPADNIRQFLLHHLQREKFFLNDSKIVGINVELKQQVYDTVGLKFHMISFDQNNHIVGGKYKFKFDFLDSIDFESDLTLSSIIDELYNAVFLSQRDIVTDWADEFSSHRICVIHHTRKDGLYIVAYNKDAYNIIIMKEDPTLGSILEYFVNKNINALMEAGVARVSLEDSNGISYSCEIF